MIGEMTDVPSRFRYLRHRSPACCPCLTISEPGQPAGGHEEDSLAITERYRIR
jgi:hypothetical protein